MVVFLKKKLFFKHKQMVVKYFTYIVVKSGRPIPVVYTNHVTNQASTGGSFERDGRTQREVKMSSRVT